MILVVDASALAAMLFDEPEGDTIRAHVRDETVLAPHLIDYELANLCWKRMRREPESAPRFLAMLAGLESVTLTRVAAPPLAVATLAARTGLSAYDAAYLWLAMTRDAELVTLDAQLARVDRALRGDPA